MDIPDAIAVSISLMNDHEGDKVNSTMTGQMYIDTDDFTGNFLINRKPMHKDLLQKISISLIEKEMTCLHGNLNYFNKLTLAN